MNPAPGERLLRFVGDRVRFFINPGGASKSWRARLRTNIGRADILRHEIIHAHAKGARFAGASWHDLPMDEHDGGWSLELSLVEPGYFKAKPYLLDSKGWQHWPTGPDVGICVHPDEYRTANILYCAFPRMFGATKSAASTRNEKLEDQISQIEEHGYTIIPPSGKLRDLIPCLPHITETLGCRILHLLPINPTPTTYARFGRFGSPYAALDLMAIDPALVVFDKRSTGVDQFRELTYATHLRGGRVFLDIVINHTGWGSVLQERHPKWFLRQPDGTFASPGAWGNIWEDLIELKHDNVALWDKLTEVFLTWCRRGVDGFRCDAGYKVPAAAWQYIIARVRQEFPETIFLLEGLGGAWETTEALLTEGGMQWAYSELFQNYTGIEVSGYLDHSLKQSEHVGLLVHYSETHDNDRLTARGRAWSLLRNRLCGLASVSGGFGFTCGVEWLATEKIRVHGSSGLAWDNRDNIVAELAGLNRLLANHPCFFDGATLTRLSPPDSPVYALLRESAESKDTALILVNTDAENTNTVTLTDVFAVTLADFQFELLGQSLPEIKASDSGEINITLLPGAAHCLSPSAEPRGLGGDAYRRARAQVAWAIQMVSKRFSVLDIGPYEWPKLARLVERSPADFLAAIDRIDRKHLRKNLQAAIESAFSEAGFPQIVRWGPSDCRRITPVPADHWVLLEDTARFRASLRAIDGAWLVNVESVEVSGGHIASFPPRNGASEATLHLERYAEENSRVEATIRFLEKNIDGSVVEMSQPKANDIVLLTNGIGGMARMCVEPGRISSKYDCVLGANLHPSLPVDRHVFAKRIRLWVNADGFISPLDFKNLASFNLGPPATWRFVANAGDGRTVEIQMTAEMTQGHNTTMFRFSLPKTIQRSAKTLPADADVRLTVRVDIEDRNFHSETRHDGGADFHFSVHTHDLPQSKTGRRAGFFFKPAADRQLQVFADAGEYHPQPEWSENIPHSVEQSRGQAGFGDAYSPGWFELPLAKDAGVTLVVTSDANESAWIETTDFKLQTDDDGDSLSARLARAARAFVVRRGHGKTVIAGYPWFLDWGRDTLICARGLLAAGMIDEVKQILITFARFEENGTLPNTIHGDNTSNRDTSDAPLWFSLACEEAAERIGLGFYDNVVGPQNRTIRDVLQSIAKNYAKATPNGIRMDEESALIWSPAHFTWMDTNYPAGTPREGYPIEIQALWIRLLQHAAKSSDGETRERFSELAQRAVASLEKCYWLQDRVWYADVLLAKSGQPAAEATASDALRSNCVFPISLGLVKGERARQCVAAVSRYLVVPGALRSLAPLPVSVPLPIQGNDGRILNDPKNPYWSSYEGDEDTCRKPAYHNGTAWTWTFPNFCEALARAWDFTPEAIAAARSYLGSMARLMNEGCLGQIPEILDGDAPHAQRGCDAQAWGVTEALRVWNLLDKRSASSH